MRFAVNGVDVGQLLQFNRTVSPNSVKNTALDGTPYIQIIGSPSQTATVEVFASSRLVRDLIDSAAADGALITVEYHGITYDGYISDAVSWKWLKKGVSAIGTLTLWVVNL